MVEAAIVETAAVVRPGRGTDIFIRRGRQDYSTTFVKVLNVSRKRHAGLPFQCSVVRKTDCNTRTRKFHIV